MIDNHYYYVVLRLAPDSVRGEIINVGIVLFSKDKQPQSILMAPLNKLRAIDATWDSLRLNEWSKKLNALLERNPDPTTAIQTISKCGFCQSESVGFFIAQNANELAANIKDIRDTYIANKVGADKQKKERRTRLQTALRDSFRKMHVFSDSISDLSSRLVVSNVPVPLHPDLKSDFVFKNGVYRVTQTIDYKVSPDNLHNKLSEACVKSTAAELALKSYGTGTLRLAVVDIPDELAEATDSHIDLLHAQGFEVFKFTDDAGMADYYRKATPQIDAH